MGQAGTLVEVNDGGLGVGAELALSGAGCLRSLQRMPATPVLATLLALAAVDVELPDDGLAWDLGLELLSALVFDDSAAASGALLGQGGFQGFLHLRGRRRFTMGMLAMLLALLAAGLFGVRLGRALGKRRRLAFDGAFEFFEALLQSKDGLPKPRVLFTQSLIFKQQFLK